MELETLTEQVTNVSMNYGFFNFRVSEYQISKYKFKIEGIRSYDRSEASKFYKSITRSINLENYNRNDAE